MKRIIFVAMLLAVVCIAVKAEDDSAKIMADQNAYVAMRAEATKLFEAKEYVKYADLMAKISVCEHAKRFPGVHAWAENNRGYAYLLAGDACQALAVLSEAVKLEYENPDWRDKVDRNRACAKAGCR